MHTEYEYTVPEGKWPLQDTGLDGKVILKTDLGEVGWEGRAWTHHVHGSDKWQAVMNKVINL